MTASLSAFMRGIFNTLFAPAARTTNTNGTGVDLVDYEGIAEVYIESAAGTGTTPTLDFKLQESNDDGSADAYADVPAAELFAIAGGTAGAFTQITTALSKQTRVIDLSARKRWIRAVETIGGTTPSFTSAAVIVAQKKYQD